MNYYYVGIHLKSKPNPMIGVKEYMTDDYHEAYINVLNYVLKNYTKDDIIKIDVWQLMEYTDAVKEYLKKKTSTAQKHI